MPTKKKPKDTIVSTSELAEWLDLTPQRLAALERKKILTKKAHGKYLLKESVIGYCRYKSGEMLGKKDDDIKRLPEGNARQRKEEAEARMAEMEADKMAELLIDVQRAESVYCDHIANARTILLTLPSRVPAVARVATKKAVYDALTEISQNIQVRDTAAEEAAEDMDAAG